MKLKTLKDMKGKLDVHNPMIIDSDKLRQEAIKWFKDEDGHIDEDE